MAGAALSAVQSQQTTLQAYGAAAFASAQNALNTLANSGVFHFSGAGKTLIESMTGYPLVSPSGPGDLVVGTPPEVSTIVMPEKPTKPEITYPSVPTITMPTMPDDPTFIWPTMGNVTLGNMLSYVQPNDPIIDFPSLAVTPPSPITISPATWSFSIDNIMITDDPMVKAIIDRLQNNITYGGTGLSADVEADIWARDKERNEQQLEDSTDKVIAMWAKRGFTLPDGMLAHSLSEIQKEYMNKMLDRTRDIAIKQAELEQSNLFKSMELGVNLSFKLIEEWVRYEELVYRSQEATAKYANEYLELTIKAHNDTVEVYKACVQAYEIQVRAELAKVEVYRAQIQAALATVQMNEQTVKLYATQIDAEIAKYKGALEADKIFAEIFSEQTRAVLAEAQIQESIIKIYVEQVRACEVKANVYKAELAGMASEIEAEKLKIEANMAQINAWAKQTDALIATYHGKLEKYKAEVQYNIAAAEINNKAEEANLRLQIEKARIAVQEAATFEHLITAQAQIGSAAAAAAAHAASSLASAALTAVNAHSAMTYGETMGLTEA